MTSPATSRFNNHGNVHPVCACVYCLGLDIPKERVTRHPALVILGSWSLFSLAMIRGTMILNSGEFTLARVLEDYHKNPLCHRSKLNAVFKSSQRFLQNKNEPGSQSSRSYSIHSFAKCYRSFISAGWQFDVWCKVCVQIKSIKVCVTSCHGFICSVFLCASTLFGHLIKCLNQFNILLCQLRRVI